MIKSMENSSNLNFPEKENRGRLISMIKDHLIINWGKN